MSGGGPICVTALAQPGAPKSSPVLIQPEAPQDVLGRTTPRSTLLGFLRAPGKGDDETAVHYLNTRLRGKAAATLANQLLVVLNRRLPARLNELSDRPEGSLVYPAKPNRDLIGTINSAKGDVDIVVERVECGKDGPLGLFSSKTLGSIPELYDEVNAVTVETVLPPFLTDTRITRIFVLAAIGVFLVQLAGEVTRPGGKRFPSANAAAQALVSAARSDDVAGLINILGPWAKEVVANRGPNADRKVRHDFAARADQKMKLLPTRGRHNARTLVVGKDEWPLPIPIVERNGQWYFDTAGQAGDPHATHSQQGTGRD